MKQFVGKQMEFIVELPMGAFRAMMVGDRREMILVKGEKDEFPRRILKSKIISYKPLEQVDEDVDLLVLGCENPTIKCPGVKYVKDGAGFGPADFKAFMNPCPRQCSTCRTGSLGELRTVTGDVLKDMMTGTMYGDYPEANKKEEDNE